LPVGHDTAVVTFDKLHRLFLDQLMLGGITTIEPNNHKVSDLEEARRAISQMDKNSHNWL